ncbi:MAG: ABC transporter permease [Desulfobulbus sp.]|jgi:ABC-2 type transport system permease protein
MPRLTNIYRLGIKELWSLIRDPMLLVLIVYSFTISIYTAATAAPETLHKVPIAIVDEDDSTLSRRIGSAFLPPHFLPAATITLPEMDPGMDSGIYTFVINIPPDFQADVIAGRRPAVQLNVDATRMSQAFTGSGSIQQIIMAEVVEFVQGYRGMAAPPVTVEQRMRFNPTLAPSWMTSVMEINSVITLLSVILTGAALIREREHGTIEHLLVMPVTPAEIMLSKVWSMALVVLLASAFSITFVVQGWLRIPVAGSVGLFLLVAGLHLFSTTSLGIFLATLARSMPQFGLLMVLIIMPLQTLSGGTTPMENMPKLIQNIMFFAPTTHFVAASQSILYRAAGLEVIWKDMVAIIAIGLVFYSISLARFRKTLSRMA